MWGLVLCHADFRLADGQCIIDLTQTSFPSHAKLMAVLSAAHIIQDHCVEKDTPSCTYSLNAFFEFDPLIWSLEYIESVSWYYGHGLSESNPD